MKKVFLGGTVDSKWRDVLIPKLKIDYFNPLVDDWTEDDYQEELKQREICDYCLYVITPRMTGVYSIAEVIDDSNKRPDKTLFLFVEADGKKTFEESQIKSLKKVAQMIVDNGAKYFESFQDLIKFLNETDK